MFVRNQFSHTCPANTGKYSCEVDTAIVYWNLCVQYFALKNFCDLILCLNQFLPPYNSPCCVHPNYDTMPTHLVTSCVSILLLITVWTPNRGGAGLLTTHPPIFKQFPKLSVANLTSKCPLLIYWSHWWSWVNSKFTDSSGVEPTRQICPRLQINGRAGICKETSTKAASCILYKAVSSARFTATLGWGVPDKEVRTKMVY